MAARRLDCNPCLIILTLVLAQALEAGRFNSAATPISARTARYCQERLSRNTSCCLDNMRADGVRSTAVRRAGAEWTCSQKLDCLDAAWGGGGRRGEDVVWTPYGATCTSPRVLFLHGGSWSYNSPMRSSYDVLATQIANLSGAIVFALDYPLVPVGNYTSIIGIAFEGLRWLAGHGPRGEPCDAQQPPPLFVGGDSSGGGTALSLVLRAVSAARRNEPGDESRLQWPAIAGAFFYSPWTNLACDSPSYFTNAFRLVNDGKDQHVYAGDIIFSGPPSQLMSEYRLVSTRYVSDNATLLTDPMPSPYYANAEFVGAPPLLFAVGGAEALLHESVLPAQRAAAHGVEVYLDIYPEMWHVFPMYSEGCGSGFELWQGKVALNRTAAFIRLVAARSNGSGLFATWSTLPHTEYVLVPTASVQVKSPNALTG
eukprot:TRINITY_DN11965_c0_g1_i1.p1 TRINITY_DN11965_c0_g1~~TRINITY_DN11965_c0_g1_i1.p1  ORF type:complete len:427 (-),score=47.52 TRINITY_DN11965_c0_g1_i1:303-1583(-)